MPDIFEINGYEIAPGEKQVVKLTVARLPSGTRIHLQAHIYRSGEPGPTALVLGGVHGDEVNGIEIVRRSMESGLYERLTAGSVIAIPLLNIFGFLQFSRDTPDGKDVNRNFPGSMAGSLSSRVARTLTKYILPLVDFGVDFHAGGASRYNYPQIRYTRDSPEAQALAEAFSAPFIIAKPPVRKSLRKVAGAKGKPMLVYEGGESLRIDGFSIQLAQEGLQRLLCAQGMLPEAPPPPRHVRHFRRTTWIRARRSGLFEWTQESGREVRKNDVLGLIRDPYGQYETKVLSPRAGFLIGHNNAPVVSQGDALFHLAYVG